MKYIYLYALDTMADWEVGYVMAELQSQRFFTTKNVWKIQICTAAQHPIKTMGGLTIQSQVTPEAISPETTSLIILPGADTWQKPEHATIVNVAKRCLEAGVPVAAICGATTALAQTGMLDARKHTSNGPDYLPMFCPNYKGGALYVPDLAVTDGNLITAGSSAPVDFAYHIFKRLGVMTPKNLEHWHAYFANHSVEDFMKLLRATMPVAKA